MSERGRESEAKREKAHLPIPSKHVRYVFVDEDVIAVGCCCWLAGLVLFMMMMVFAGVWSV